MKAQSKAPVRSQSVSLESKRRASHFRLSEGSNCVPAGRSCGFCFLHSERQGQEDRRLRAGQGSGGRTSGNRRFRWGRVLDRTAAASGNRLRNDGMRDRANSKGRHHPRDPRRAGVCRVIYRRTSWLATVVSRRTLVDQLFNSSEKRLARILLLLANFGKEGRPEPIIAKISQETLAEMIGTTRSRVSFFMNKFRELGLIDYNGHIEVHSSLLNVVLHDQPQIRR